MTALIVAAHHAHHAAGDAGGGLAVLAVIFAIGYAITSEPGQRIGDRGRTETRIGSKHGKR